MLSLSLPLSRLNLKKFYLSAASLLLLLLLDWLPIPDLECSNFSSSLPFHPQLSSISAPPRSSYLRVCSRPGQAHSNRLGCALDD
ncbi:hypothetical protein CRG98_039889 [Punica granatum]|uniref:Uncharacterized protein n=1 Tax=Punica granatum TaxID=22663 RepID=A0A2I0I6T9_PUNGR|nr:hypothetical protein CRG98_039889 [Punica granatum]